MKYKEKERETQEVGNAVLDCVLTEGPLQIGGTVVIGSGLGI